MSTRFRAKFATILVFVVAATAVLAGCKQQGTISQVAAKSGGQLNYFLGEPLSLDPAFAQENEGMQVIKQLFDGLVEYDPKTLEAKPAVAARWRANDSADKWTFWLRNNVSFHNGRPVTARDFAYAWDRVASKKTASEIAYLLAPIKGFDDVQSGKSRHLAGVEVTGRYTLEVTLDHPYTEFPTLLGHPAFSPVPKNEVTKKRARFAEAPVGNGPFAMDGPWLHNRSITLKRFKNYYRQVSHLEKVHFKIVNNEQAAFLQFKGGALHYSSIPSGQIKPTVAQYGSSALVGKPQLALLFYGLNLRRAPFKKNVELRQAINYVINRTVIAEKIYEGTHVAAESIVPPGMTGNRKPKESYSYSIKKAKSLLKKAGHAGGRGLPTMTVIYPAGRGSDGPAQIIQENLREIGIEVKLSGLEFGAFINALRAGKASMFAGKWQADYPSRDTFLYSLFHSESGDNVMGFKDKEVDKLLEQARAESDKKRRLRLYEKAESQILKKAPIVPVTFIGSNGVHAPEVKGFIRTSLDYTPLDQVWLTKELR